MHDLELLRGLERERVIEGRDREYTLRGSEQPHAVDRLGVS